MRNLLSMAAAGLVIFAGLGWYMDWYKVQRTPGPDGHQTIKIDVNTQEIRKDLQNARQKVGEVLGNNVPAQPTGYNVPASPTYPGGQPYPGQPAPIQPYPGQPYPGQQYPAPQYPAQQYPQYQNPTPGYPAGGQQPYPAQGYPQTGSYPQPGTSNWAPAAPATSRPYDGGTYVFPGNPGSGFVPTPPGGTNARRF